jgi:hypothetical protein
MEEFMCFPSKELTKSWHGQVPEPLSPESVSLAKLSKAMYVTAALVITVARQLQQLLRTSRQLTEELAMPSQTT